MSGTSVDIKTGKGTAGLFRERNFRQLVHLLRQSKERGYRYFSGDPIGLKLQEEFLKIKKLSFPQSFISRRHFIFTLNSQKSVIHEVMVLPLKQTSWP